MSDGEPGRMTDPPLSAPKIRFCNNGDEVRRGLRRYDAAHVLSASSNGYTGSADLATGAMAKRIFGEAHRFDPTRLSRPCCCVRRAASSPSAQFLSKILQRGSHAPIAVQGRADPACGPDCRSHAGDAGSGRTAPPIFQGVSFRQGQVSRRANANDLRQYRSAPFARALNRAKRSDEK